MSNEDRQNRSNRLRRRFERESGETEDEAIEQDRDAKTSKRSKTAQTDKTEGSVKDRPSVLMYLPEEIHEELDIRFDELNAKYKRVHGEKLEKNRDYYPAVITAALDDSDLEDVLDV